MQNIFENLHIPVVGSLTAQLVKKSAYNAGDPGLISGSGRSAGQRNGNPLQHSCLKNPMDCSLPGSSVHEVTRVGHDLVTKPPPCIPVAELCA